MGCVGSGVGVQSWFNTFKLKPTVQLRNYNTPLTTQVEKLEPEEHLCNIQVTTTQVPPTQPPISQVRFTLNPSTSRSNTCTADKTLDLVNGDTSKGGDTSKVVTTNSGATSKGGDTPNSGSPSPAETFTLTGNPTRSNRR